jgi:hypothetical protein
VRHILDLSEKGGAAVRGRFLRDLWLGQAEKAEWKEINDQLIALSAWRRLWRRLRVRGSGPKDGPKADEA